MERSNAGYWTIAMDRAVLNRTVLSPGRDSVATIESAELLLPDEFVTQTLQDIGPQLWMLGVTRTQPLSFEVELQPGAFEMGPFKLALRGPTLVRATLLREHGAARISLRLARGIAMVENFSAFVRRTPLGATRTLRLWQTMFGPLADPVVDLWGAAASQFVRQVDFDIKPDGTGSATYHASGIPIRFPLSADDVRLLIAKLFDSASCARIMNQYQQRWLRLASLQSRPAHRRSDMRALVLGGSGLIGNAIVRELVARGYQVTAVGRRPAPATNLAELDVDYVSADLDTNVSLRERFATQQLVVDAAAPYPLHLFARTVERAPSESVVRRTERLLEALKDLDVRFAYIGTSTTRRPAEPRTLVGMQSAFVHRIHPYFAIKEAIEARVSEAAANGLRAVIVRPTVCLGPWDVKPRELCWIPALIAGRILVTPQQRLNVIDTRDLAKTVVTALEHERYGSPIVATGHNTTVEKLFELVCEQAGDRATRVEGSRHLERAASRYGRNSRGPRSAAPRRSPLSCRCCSASRTGSMQLPSGGTRTATARTKRDDPGCGELVPTNRLLLMSPWRTEGGPEVPPMRGPTLPDHRSDRNARNHWSDRGSLHDLADRLAGKLLRSACGADHQPPWASKPVIVPI